MIDITKLFIQASDKVDKYKRKPLRQTLTILVKSSIDLSFFDNPRCTEFRNRTTVLLGKDPKDLYRTKTVLKQTV